MKCAIVVAPLEESAPPALPPEDELSATLPSTQAHMLAVSKKSGLSLEDAFGRLGEIIKHGEPDVALIGIRTLFDYTTGRAPSNNKSVSLHMHGKSSDAFFGPNKEAFEKPPAPRLDD